MWYAFTVFQNYKTPEARKFNELAKKGGAFLKRKFFGSKGD